MHIQQYVLVLNIFACNTCRLSPARVFCFLLPCLFCRVCGWWWGGGVCWFVPSMFVSSHCCCLFCLVCLLIVIVRLLFCIRCLCMFTGIPFVMGQVAFYNTRF